MVFTLDWVCELGYYWHMNQWVKLAIRRRNRGGSENVVSMLAWCGDCAGDLKGQLEIVSDALTEKRFAVARKILDATGLNSGDRALIWSYVELGYQSLELQD